MNWKKLQTLDCPACGKPLTKNLLGYNCTKCEFKIGNKKFESVVASTYRSRTSESEDESFDRAFDEQAERDEMDLEGDDYAPCACGMPKIACKCWE